MDQSVKLRLYNGALRRLGERKLSSLTEARKPRRVLDTIWGGDNEVIHYCLERGDWNFAMKSAEGSYSTSVTPSFGFQRAFTKPEDMKRLSALSASATLTPPLTNDQYRDEAGYWYADVETIYVSYVSDADDYGLDASKWSEQFKEMVELKLAYEACDEITNSERKLQRLDAQLRAAMKSAKSHDAMAEGVKFPPRGSWVAARGGGRSRENA